MSGSTTEYRKGNVIVAMNVRYVMDRLGSNINEMKKGFNRYYLANMDGNDGGADFELAFLEYHKDKLRYDTSILDDWFKKHKSRYCDLIKYRSLKNDVDEIMSHQLIQ